jgi:MYXO-CTERM domain-containing protein
MAISFFLPFPAESGVLQLIGMFLQAAAVAALLARRRRRSMGWPDAG